jgi:hypothetical protein
MIIADGGARNGAIPGRQNWSELARFPAHLGAVGSRFSAHSGDRLQSTEDTVMTRVHRLTRCQTPREFWSKNREASLNWLALGLLLAAWNASDNEVQNAVSVPMHQAKGHKTVNEL